MSISPCENLKSSLSVHAPTLPVPPVAELTFCLAQGSRGKSCVEDKEQRQTQGGLGTENLLE
eukprot:749451-Hanusia_phi.AAC.2